MRTRGRSRRRCRSGRRYDAGKVLWLRRRVDTGLTLHVGRRWCSCVLVDGHDHSVTMTRDQTQQIEFPLLPAVASYRGDSSAGRFRPSDHEPGSTDRRWLGLPGSRRACDEEALSRARRRPFWRSWPSPTGSIRFAKGLNGNLLRECDLVRSAGVCPPLDPQPSNDRLLSGLVRGAPPHAFSAAWAGSLLAMHDGTYALATISDDGSSVYVDGQLVVDNGGRRVWPRGATGARHPDVEACTRFTFGTRRTGRRAVPYGTALGASRAAARTDTGVGADAASGRLLGRSRSSAGLKRSLAAAEWVWVGSIVLWALTIGWSWIAKREGMARRRGRLARAQVDPRCVADR